LCKEQLMNIKLSQSEWRRIGRMAGWLKGAGWGGRSDDGPPDPEEGEKLRGMEVEVPFEDIDVPEYPGVLFNGTYIIEYDYEFPVHDGGDDEITINDIWVNGIRCSPDPMTPDAACPSEEEMARGPSWAVRRELLDPKNGFPHRDHVREDAQGNDPRPDPEAYDEDRGL